MLPRPCASRMCPLPPVPLAAAWLSASQDPRHPLRRLKGHRAPVCRLAGSSVVGWRPCSVCVCRLPGRRSLHYEH